MFAAGAGRRRPATFADPIVKEPGVYGTHHIGASTDQAQEAIAAETVRIVKTFMETGQVPNAVQLESVRPVMTTAIKRIYNFSAGPAVLPLPVLEEAQRDLVALPGVGMSVMEISHRSKTFDEIIQGAEADMRALGGIPANYKVLFLQGGASLQFSMVPMNLLTPGATADYIVTGDWAQEGAEGSQARRRDARRGVDRGRQLQAHSEAGRAEAHAGRRLRAHDVEQHDSRHRVALRCRTSAARRSSATRRRTSSRGRSTSRSSA